MAITYPRDIPEINGHLPFGRARFDLERLQTAAPTRGGWIQAADLGPPLWVADYVSVGLNPDNGDRLQAWLASLDGRLKTFKGWDPRKAFPRAYANFDGLVKVDAAPFTGTAMLDAVSAANDEITLSGLPEGFLLQENDRLSFAHGTTRALHMVIDSDAADATGKGTWTVRPRVAPGSAEGTVVDLVKPWCVMTVDPESIDIVTAGRNRTRISFSATQSL